MIDLRKTLDAHRDGVPVRLVDPTTGDEGTVYLRPTRGNLAYSARFGELEASYRAGRILEIQDDPAASKVLTEALRRMRAVGSDSQDVEAETGLSFELAAWQYDQLTASPNGVRDEHRRRALPGTVLVGWNEDDFGVPYSDEAAAEMLAVPWIWQQVDAALQHADAADAQLRELLKARVEGPFNGGSDGGPTSGASKSEAPKRKRSTARKSKRPKASPSASETER